jgi:hypothetical protein
MWFRRKAVNRRLHRDTVLDVKMRSDQEKSGRRRWVARVLAWCFGLVIAVGAVCFGGSWMLSYFIIDNSVFALRHIIVQTDGIVAAEQVRQWGGVAEGINVFRLDLVRIKRDLELAPVVQSAAVERILPDTLILMIVEREPVAQVYSVRPKAGGVEFEPAVYLLDSAGSVMMPLSRSQTVAPSGQSLDGLPVVTGIPGPDLQPGRVLTSIPVRSALQLIADFENSTMAGVAQIKQIDIHGPDVLRVVTTQDSEITFGAHGVGDQLRRWQAIYESGLRTGKAVGGLDLSVTNNIPVRWLEASAMPASVIKSSKPPRTKRKHV